MKLFVFLVMAFMLQQSISQPAVVPTHCISSPCKIVIGQNTTEILVAKESSTGTITDSLGGIWVRDFCTPFDYGECIFHAKFSYPYPIGDTLTFPSGGYADVYILQYEGTWSFATGQQGTYATENAPFPDCANGGDCPYNWTKPVEADAGNLLIAYSFPQSTLAGIPKPGLGWNVEANDGVLAVEDMIASTEGVYIGSLVWKMSDGSASGGSHWLMGIGVYVRVN